MSLQANVESAIEHIALAQAIDALVVAPATADVLARFAQGIANDFLSTLYLATTAPVVVAPAMNVNMWNHAATQANLEILRQRGVRIVEPGSGYLACGMTGAGRLAANEAIVAAVMETLGAAQDLAGETVLVTAGPTREKIDPVRYLTNRSSGRMGYAIAEAALRRGARVLLVSGPSGDRRSGCGGIDASGDRGRNAGGGFEIAASEHGGDQDGGCGGFPAESRRRNRRSSARAR